MQPANRFDMDPRLGLCAVVSGNQLEFPSITLVSSCSRAAAGKGGGVCWVSFGVSGPLPDASRGRR